MRYYLLDASALLDYVLNFRDPKVQRVRQAVSKLVALHEQRRASLFVPNICMAECSKAIARKAYAGGWSSEGDDVYARHVDVLLKLVSTGRSGKIRSLELRHEHLRDIEDVFRLEYQMPARERKSRLSGVDAVVIAMGRELARQYGNDRVVIVTAEWWMAEVCGRNRGALPAAVCAVERPVPDA